MKDSPECPWCGSKLTRSVESVIAKHGKEHAIEMLEQCMRSAKTDVAYDRLWSLWYEVDLWVRRDYMSHPCWDT